MPILLQWRWWNWSRVHKSIDDILRGLGHKYVKRFQFSSPFPNIQHRYTRVRVWQELIDFPWKYERKYLHFSLKFSQINSSKTSSINFKSSFFKSSFIILIIVLLYIETYFHNENIDPLSTSTFISSYNLVAGWMGCQLQKLASRVC